MANSFKVRFNINHNALTAKKHINLLLFNIYLRKKLNKKSDKVGRIEINIKFIFLFLKLTVPYSR